MSLQQTPYGEVTLLRRDPARRLAGMRLDVPPGLRADQLLTGDLFGSARPPTSAPPPCSSRHGRLLLQPQTSVVKAEPAGLEDKLRQRASSFAETSIERMAQNAAAEVAAGSGST